MSLTCGDIMQKSCQKQYISNQNLQIAGFPNQISTFQYLCSILRYVTKAVQRLIQD